MITVHAQAGRGRQRGINAVTACVLPKEETSRRGGLLARPIETPIGIRSEGDQATIRRDETPGR